MFRMTREEYEWNKKEALKRESEPYMFCNEELAKEFYDRIKKEYPASSIHYHGVTQWICLDDRARVALRKQITRLLNETKKQLDQLSALMLQMS